MKFLKLLSQNKKKNELNFFYEKISYGDYGYPIKRIKKSNIEKIKKKLLKFKKTMPLISTYFGGYYFPFLDVDDEKQAQNLIKVLKKTNYNYAIISSSEKTTLKNGEIEKKTSKYWFIIDVKCKKFNEAYIVARTLSNSDMHALLMALNNKMFYLRGICDIFKKHPLCGDCFMRWPRFVYMPSKNISKEFRNFIIKLENYYNSLDFKFLSTLYIDGNTSKKDNIVTPIELLALSNLYLERKLLIEKTKKY